MVKSEAPTIARIFSHNVDSDKIEAKALFWTSSSRVSKQIPLLTLLETLNRACIGKMMIRWTKGCMMYDKCSKNNSTCFILPYFLVLNPANIFRFGNRDFCYSVWNNAMILKN